MSRAGLRDAARRARREAAMLKSGADHLESLRDGRTVYVGSERIADVTRHRAFRNAARSVAALYDLKRREDIR
jgi:4-hydroxyphenylacetate 3-monooxygenase